MKKNKLNILIIIVLTIVVLYLSLKDDYNKILPLLFEVNLIWLFISYLFVLSYTFLKSIVTYNLINNFKEYSFIKTFKLQFMTFFFNAITPFSSGGQPFQVYVLNKDNVSLPSATNIIVQETIVHQIALSIVILITYILNCLFNFYDLNITMKLLLVISFFINAIVIVFLIVLSHGKNIDNTLGKFIINLLYKLKIIKNKEEKIKKWETSIGEFNIASKKLLANKSKFIKLIVLNTIALISLYIVPLVILFSLGNYNSFNGLTAIVLTSFISIICSYVPLPGGSLGQEYLFTMLFSQYIFNPILTSLMLLWRLITYYLPMIIGALIFNINKKN